MTSHETDTWQLYWESVLEGGRRLQAERAAADPTSRWLVAEAPVLVGDEFDIDPTTLRDRPDETVRAARDGFEALLTDEELATHDDDRYGYELLPIHLTAVGRIEGLDFSFTDPVNDANTLTTIDGAAVLDGPTRWYEPAVLTWRCPRGHEMSHQQPLLRNWSVETCLREGCSADVVPDDARTRVRRVARFTVDTGGGAIQCVATGRYAADTEYDRLASAQSLHLTGVSRLLADGDGSIEPTYEVLAAEAASPR
jgi:hypothetical protein